MSPPTGNTNVGPNFSIPTSLTNEDRSTDLTSSQRSTRNRSLPPRYYTGPSLASRLKQRAQRQKYSTQADAVLRFMRVRLR